MSNSKDRYTAIHEAGHVVAHMLFSDAAPESFSYATIEKDEHAAGHVKGNKWLKDKDPDLFSFESFTDPAATLKELRKLPPEFADQQLEELAQEITQQEIEAQLCISLAGEAATYIETSKRDAWGSGRESFAGDFKTCFEFVSRIFSCGYDPESDRAAESYLEALFWRTVILLKRPLWWARVNAIADGLIEKRTLTATECDEIARSAVNEAYEAARASS